MAQYQDGAYEILHQNASPPSAAETWVSLATHGLDKAVKNLNDYDIDIQNGDAWIKDRTDKHFLIKVVDYGNMPWIRIRLRLRVNAGTNHIE